MRTALAAIVLGLAMLAGIYWWRSSREAPQVAFECPVIHQTTTTTALKETATERDGVTQALRGPELENTVLVIVNDLKERYPTADTPEIVNYLVAAYCPIVAKDNGLSEREKREQTDLFSSQIYQIIGHQQ
jgi:hypothetical protein